jgi:hypothetical protein
VLLEDGAVAAAVVVVDAVAAELSDFEDELSFEGDESFAEPLSVAFDAELSD